ncbi:MAG TPA: DUF2269 domain-containing protein [Rhizomicrobium sp.]|jgi:uncharacterized membrane protein
MTLYFLIKTVHVLSATVLFGTGLGIAFFMFQSRFTGDLREKYFALRTTVLADALFTLPAAVVQPVTGAWLVANDGFQGSEPWLIASYALYGLAVLCWVPVIWIQVRLKQIAAACLASSTPLPPLYRRLFRIWFILGWPAFAALLAVFFLMIAKPG